MTDLACTTVSPSISRMSRSTPWVDGCCGPMLRMIRSSSAKSASANTVSQSPPVTVTTRSLRVEAVESSGVIVTRLRESSSSSGRKSSA